jgi:hypothetical protein
MGELVVRRAVLADADAIAHVLAAAFDDYAWTRWTVEATDHAARVAALQRLAFTELVLPFGEAWVATADAAIVSAALWMRPDAPVPDDVWGGLERRHAELEGDRHAASVSAVMKPVLERVVDQGATARLETCGEANVAFYRRLGFRVTDTVTIPDGGPTVALMALGD